MRLLRSPGSPTLAPALAALAGALAAAGCAPAIAQGPPAPSTVATATADTGMRVEKVREELQLAPWDLAFSAVRGTGEVTETVTARNLTDDPVTVRALPVLGDQAAPFQLRNPPKLPAIVPPRGQLSVEVTFAPAADAALGVHRALLRFQTGPTRDDGPGTDLSALATLGRAGEREPSLADVVEALGYAVDVRGGGARSDAPGVVPAAATKAGPGSPRPLGDEVTAPLFVRATPTLVAINPVARFSEDGPRPFGPYTVQADSATPQTLATLAAGQHQTLNPELEPGGNASFDPGDAVFGLWVRAGKRMLYSDDRRNAGADRHAARVFPLRARGGAPVANAYLVAFRDGGDEAFQDYVFVLWNVKPVPAAGGSDGPRAGAGGDAVTAPASRSP
jgi:hypothetical protein